MVGRKRDWWRIIRDLSHAGVSMQDIASRCNRDKGTVKFWAEGSDPKESDARVVLHLYAIHCPEKYRVHAQEFDIRLPELCAA